RPVQDLCNSAHEIALNGPAGGGFVQQRLRKLYCRRKARCISVFKSSATLMISIWKIQKCSEYQSIAKAYARPSSS
ncbi:hypothetical protein, partial [Chromobacterium amazonense]